MNNREKQAARTEKKQQKIQAGFMSSIFPDVKSIVISMVYSQRGIGQPLPRTVNFFPNSYAFFMVDCLSKECVEGGFDFTRIITSMVGNHHKTSNGKLGCQGGPDENHSSIVYEVAIQYG